MVSCKLSIARATVVIAASSAGAVFLDNGASNAISRSLGYKENGLDWATRRGQPFQLQRWVLARACWETIQRTDITLVITWDGKNINGVVNPGFDGAKLQNATLEPKGWMVHFEADAKEGRIVAGE